MKKLAILALALTALMIAPVRSAAEDQGYRVIVNKDNPADSITRSELSQYLLKKSSRWGNGFAAKVDPVDLDSGSDVREAFSRAIHKRSVASIKNYWQRQIFSGRGVPPPEVASDAAVISHVQSRPGAIGYVSPRANLDSNVKVVSVSDR